MVMISYTVASMTVPWLAMALPSWRYLAIISSTAVLPILLGYRCVPLLSTQYPVLSTQYSIFY